MPYHEPCPRCGILTAVTFSRRGTKRVHHHKRPDGKPCYSPTNSPVRAAANAPAPESPVDPDDRELFGVPDGVRTEDWLLFGRAAPRRAV